MIYFTAGEERIALGDELRIETDGKRLYFEGSGVEFEKEYDSVLEILGIMMWLMTNVKKTTVVFKEGTQDFVRKREYQGYKDKLRLLKY